MELILHIQNLSPVATISNVHRFFVGCNIPQGGVQIVGGEDGDAFISFQSEQDLLRALNADNQPLLGQPLKLFLAKEADVQKVIDKRNRELDRVKADFLAATKRTAYGDESASYKNFANDQEQSTSSYRAYADDRDIPSSSHGGYAHDQDQPPSSYRAYADDQDQRSNRYNTYTDDQDILSRSDKDYADDQVEPSSRYRAYADDQDPPSSSYRAYEDGDTRIDVQQQLSSRDGAYREEAERFQDYNPSSNIYRGYGVEKEPDQVASPQHFDSEDSTPDTTNAFELAVKLLLEKKSSPSHSSRDTSTRKSSSGDTSGRKNSSRNTSGRDKSSHVKRGPEKRSGDRHHSSHCDKKLKQEKEEEPEFDMSLPFCAIVAQMELKKKQAEAETHIKQKHSDAPTRENYGDRDDRRVGEVKSRNRDDRQGDQQDRRKRESTKDKPTSTNSEKTRGSQNSKDGSRGKQDRPDKAKTRDKDAGKDKVKKNAVTKDKPTSTVSEKGRGRQNSREKDSSRGKHSMTKRKDKDASKDKLKKNAVPDMPKRHDRSVEGKNTVPLKMSEREKSNYQMIGEKRGRDKRRDRRSSSSSLSEDTPLDKSRKTSDKSSTRTRRSSRDRESNGKRQDRSVERTATKLDCIGLYNLDLTVTATDIRKFLKSLEIPEGGIILRTDRFDPNAIKAFIKYHPKENVGVRSLIGTFLHGRPVDIKPVPLELFDREKVSDQMIEETPPLAPTTDYPNYPTPHSVMDPGPMWRPQMPMPAYGPRPGMMGQWPGMPPKGMGPPGMGPPGMGPSGMGPSGMGPRSGIGPRPGMIRPPGMPPGMRPPGMMAPWGIGPAPRIPPPYAGPPFPAHDSAWGPGHPDAYTPPGSETVYYIRLNPRVLPLHCTACQVWSWFGGPHGASEHAIIVTDRKNVAIMAFVGFLDMRQRDKEIAMKAEMQGDARTHYIVQRELYEMSQTMGILQSTDSGIDKDITALIADGPNPSRSRRSSSRELEWGGRLPRSMTRSQSGERSKTRSWERRRSRSLESVRGPSRPRRSRSREPEQSGRRQRSIAKSRSRERSRARSRERRRSKSLESSPGASTSHGKKPIHYIRLSPRVLPLDSTACSVWSMFGGPQGSSEHAILVTDIGNAPEVAFIAYVDLHKRDKDITLKVDMKGDARTEYIVNREVFDSGKIHGNKVLQSTESGVDTDITSRIVNGPDPGSGRRERKRKSVIGATHVTKPLHYIRLNPSVIPPLCSACQAWSWFGGAHGSAKHAIVIIDQEKTMTKEVFIAFLDEKQRDKAIEIATRQGKKGSKISQSRIEQQFFPPNKNSVIMQSTESDMDIEITDLVPRNKVPKKSPQKGTEQSGQGQKKRARSKEGSKSPIRVPAYRTPRPREERNKHGDGTKTSVEKKDVKKVDKKNLRRVVKENIKKQVKIMSQQQNNEGPDNNEGNQLDPASGVKVVDKTETAKGSPVQAAIKAETSEGSDVKTADKPETSEATTFDVKSGTSEGSDVKISDKPEIDKASYVKAEDKIETDEGSEVKTADKSETSEGSDVKTVDKPETGEATTFDVKSGTSEGSDVKITDKTEVDKVSDIKAEDKTETAESSGVKAANKSERSEGSAYDVKAANKTETAEGSDVKAADKFKTDEGSDIKVEDNTEIVKASDIKVEEKTETTEGSVKGETDEGSDIKTAEKTASGEGSDVKIAEKIENDEGSEVKVGSPVQAAVKTETAEGSLVKAANKPETSEGLAYDVRAADKTETTEGSDVKAADKIETAEGSDVKATDKIKTDEGSDPKARVKTERGEGSDVEMADKTETDESIDVKAANKPETGDGAASDIAENNKDSDVNN